MKTIPQIIEELNLPKDSFLKNQAATCEALVKAGMEEGIRASAKSAMCKPVVYSKEDQKRRCPSKVYCPVDHQSILNLLNEIK